MYREDSSTETLNFCKPSSILSLCQKSTRPLSEIRVMACSVISRDLQKFSALGAVVKHLTQEN